MGKILSGMTIAAFAAGALLLSPTSAMAASSVQPVAAVKAAVAKCPKGYTKRSDRVTLIADVKFGISLASTTDTYIGTWCSKGNVVKNLDMKHFGTVDWIGAKSTSSKKIHQSTKTIKKTGVVIYSSDIRNIANFGFGFKGFAFQQKKEWHNNYVFGVSPKGHFTYGDGKNVLPARVGSK